MESHLKSFDLAELVFNDDASRILSITLTKPRRVIEISQMLGIPQVSCYRRVNDLEKMGLLESIGKSKRNRIYSSNLGRVSLQIDQGRMILTTEFRDGDKNSFDMDIK
jgi:predicted transcriptional regulator